MGLADDSKLPLGEDDRPLAAGAAMDIPIPGFCLTPYEAAQVMSILVSYEPYDNGTTALFWHITGLIGQARKKPDPEGGWLTPAGKLLGVDIAPPCSCSYSVDPFCWHHGFNKGSATSNGGKS